ncbi:MAG: Wzz/FepE/Etk N-terminal domain-containing protein [Pseudomonadota bacterium]
MQSNHVEQDYIDLLDVFRIVWQGKWIIIFTSVAGLLASFLYLENLPSKYTLKVPFEIDLYSIEALNFCGNNKSCLQAETIAMLQSQNKTGWSIGKDQAFTRTISDVSTSNSYVAELEQLRETANQSIKSGVEREFDILQKQMPKALAASETITRHILAATRLRTALAEDGAQVITLDQPIIQSANRSKWTVVMAFSLLGLIGGFVLVFLRHFVRSIAQRLESD